MSATFRPQRFDPGYWFGTVVLRGKPTPASERVPEILAREAKSARILARKNEGMEMDEAAEVFVPEAEPVAVAGGDAA